MPCNNVAQNSLKTERYETKQIHNEWENEEEMNNSQKLTIQI